MSRVPVPLRRLGYRIAYRLLVLGWLLRRKNTQGVKCLITDGDQVLLVRHSYGSSDWDVPGGGMHRYEAPLSTAEREAEEELGLIELRFRYLGSLRSLVNHRSDTIYCFHARVSAPEITPDLGELRETRWFSRAALPEPRVAHVDAIVDLLRS